MSDPDGDDPVVGHKTHVDDQGRFTHTPLRKRETAELMDRLEKHRVERAARLPDEQSAVAAMFDAFDRLRELGWKEIEYCPKDGSSFDAIEAGSTGIHRCLYTGEWPAGSWWVEDKGDLWPSMPILWRRAIPAGKA